MQPSTRKASFLLITTGNERNIRAQNETFTARF